MSRAIDQLIRIIVLAGVVLWLAGCATSMPGHSPRSSASSPPASIDHYQLASSFVSARTLTGLRLPLLDAATVKSGLIGGVTRPTADSQTLTSGFYWRSQVGSGQRLAMQLLQSEVNDDNGMGSESLLQVSSRLLSGQSWLPRINAAFSFAHRATDTGSSTAGSAFELGLQGVMADVSYHLHVTRSDMGFRPLGSSLEAGRTLVRATTNYQLNKQTHIRQNGYYSRTGAGGIDWGNSLSLSTHAMLLPGGFQSLHFQAQVHGSQLSPRTGMGGDFRLTFGGRQWAWQEWSLSSAVTWEDVFGPASGSAQGRYSWLVESGRSFDWGIVRSRIALQKEAGGLHGWQPSFGVAMILKQLARNMSLTLNYLAAGVRETHDEDTVQVMLRYNTSVGNMLSGLDSLFQGLRPEIRS